MQVKNFLKMTKKDANITVYRQDEEGYSLVVQSVAADSEDLKPVHDCKVVSFKAEGYNSINLYVK